MVLYLNLLFDIAIAIDDGSVSLSLLAVWKKPIFSSLESGNSWFIYYTLIMGKIKWWFTILPGKVGTFTFSSFVAMCRSASKKQNQVILEVTLNKTKQNI